MLEAQGKNIKEMIYTIRGHQVKLDSGLTWLYGYELKALNQQVKRNIEKFSNIFMFQLEKDKFDNLKSQFVNSS